MIKLIPILSLELTLKLIPIITFTDYIRAYFSTLTRIHLETHSHTDIHILLIFKFEIPFKL